jgi:hypothetical protein
MPRILPLVLLLLAGCAAADAPFEERKLATIAGDARVLVPVTFSQDGRRAAYVEQRADACRMVTGDHVGKPYGLLC